LGKIGCWFFVIGGVLYIFGNELYPFVLSSSGGKLKFVTMADLAAFEPWRIRDACFEFDLNCIFAA
jgi:hypothetical protein